MNTTERGYGAAHQAERARRISQWRPGDRCPRCGELLDGNPDHMDLGHIDGSAKQRYAGLEHKHCNRAAGARWRNMKQRYTRNSPAPSPAPQPWQPSRTW